MIVMSILETLSHLTLLFTLYSFIGWACESIFCSVIAKQWVNRGFLNGPFCPVYGFGALLSIFCLSPFVGKLPFPWDYVLLYLAGVVILSILEYFTGWLLETLFHTKWWDYSNHKFQIHGRVCLTNALLFGLMAVILLQWIHPAAEWLLSLLPQLVKFLLAGVLAAYFISDCVVTVRSILQLNGRLAQLQHTIDEIRARTQTFSDAHRAELIGAMDGLRKRADFLRDEAQSQLQQTLDKVREEPVRTRLRQLLETELSIEKSRAIHRRLLKAFPEMKTRWPESLERLRESSKIWKETHKRRKKK